MFDKLIESNMAGAEFKPRRTFFMVSFVVVGIVFLSALVFDLYAANIDLGTDDFELAELLAPITADKPEPERPRQQPEQRNDRETSDLPVRRQAIASVDQPTKMPTEISTAPNTGLSLPPGKFILDPNGVETNGDPMGPVGDRVAGGSATEAVSRTGEPTEVREPPPPAVKAELKKTVLKSEGVINGKATYLPNPAYPAPAKMVGAFGIVNVQVVIDEDGKVISSKAVSGHPLLRPTAESAAWKAKFSTTYLSKVPVKVTGVIVFNFKKS